MFHSRKLFRPQKLNCFIETKSKLRFLIRNVNLNQAVNNPLVLFPLLVNFLEKLQAIHRMDQADEGSDIFYFIRLQVPEQVPFNIMRKLLVLFYQFLHLILPENSLSSLVASRISATGL